MFYVKIFSNKRGFINIHIAYKSLRDISKTSVKIGIYI